MNFGPSLKRKMDITSNDWSDNAKRLMMETYTLIKENIDPNKMFSIKAKKSENNIGCYDLLPDEIFIKILKKLDVEDLANFCLTNSKLRNFVIDNFLLSFAGYHFLIRASQLDVGYDTEKQTCILNLFSSIGFLIKKSTFVFPTLDRIDILMRVFENSYGIPNYKTFQNFTFINFKFIFKCYGRIINKFILGWGESECAKVYNELKAKAQIAYHLERFLKNSLGSKNRFEIFIRHFYRMICNCSASNDTMGILKEKLFWLIQELSGYSQDKIAKILIVVFGPFISVNNAVISLPFVAWWDLTDTNFIKNGFEDLGIVLNIYFEYGNESTWSQEFIFQLFDRIVNTPARWTSMNIASLLYYCGENLTLYFLCKKMKDGGQQRLANVAQYLVYLNAITYQITRNLTSVSKLIQTLIQQFGPDLIEEIAHASTSMMFENDHHDENQNDILPLFEIIQSQIELMRLLMVEVHYLKKFI